MKKHRKFFLALMLLFVLTSSLFLGACTTEEVKEATNSSLFRLEFF